ncbi:DNA gyrase subunit A [Alicyclobacillus cycloheptanicus]|uniref:DNA gyrase subunit A n=1 Tax=Alicyclobacillus cycloheptanicus TaxID=1457 RepID=A0ABT9XKX1_9BACL|nr:DNA gyrase subunit A [Alicyclobacillus cycloheptanicus]MDQ0190957.1 DNA gyrase subunit A [Alicyclobacillus cycloheptanicus]WDM02405.1 DNA gyrase subunit A [Alicyclobacillus cycloheptanicus]
MADNFESKVLPIELAQELKNSFLDYAMSTIVSRAIPDVRDGLKPVHRRILYAMFESGMTPDKPYKKSARIVGDVLGKYHPHGDSAVYDALVRMAQDFSTRYLLVDGHGNFGSVDGDPAAAMRYTESRMSSIAMELLRDINKETVDFGPNYDGNEQEPLVLPSRFPNLLVNGSSGIAVGMATNIPPHNLREVIDGVVMMIDKPDTTVQDLMQVIKGPDFPTGGIILGREGIKNAYETGRGSIQVRATTQFEEASGGKTRIIVTELPYQQNKARLIEKIAELTRDKKIDGITDLRDESDRDGMRIVIELRRDVRPQVVLNNLFKHTGLQGSFGVINLALVNGQPKVLNLRDMLFYYLEHQREVVRRRTQFDLNKAEARAHILEGLLIALDHLDEVIALIRGSATPDIAREGLMNRFSLSHEQAQAILDMRLQRLTGLEREKIETEYAELQKLIGELRAILGDEKLLLDVIRKELVEIREKFGDERRTRIVAAEGEISEEDLIPVQDVAIAITHAGYVKRIPLSTYHAQRRGGRGMSMIGTREEDFVEHMYITSSHHFLLFFTNRGRMYALKAYEIPEFGRQAKGLPIINLLQIEQGEKISAVIPIRTLGQEDIEGMSLFFATRQGIVKKTLLSEYANIRRTGLIAIHLRDDDEVIGVKLTDGRRDIIMATRNGMSIRFNESDVRTMGRSATGVKGIQLSDADEVIGMDVIEEGTQVLVATTRGYGKKTPTDDYRIQTRGGKGIKTLNCTPKNGYIVGLKMVHEDDDLMIITNAGVAIRIQVSSISTQGRNTQGVKLINVPEGEEVATVALVVSSEDED